MNILLRIVLLIPGIFLRIIESGKNGSRDIINRIRFKQVKVGINTCLNSYTKINKFVTILDNCVINDVIIDSYTYIGKDSVIQNAEIGKFCSIASGVLVGLGTHPLHFVSTSPLFYRVVNPINLKLIDKAIGVEEYKKTQIGNDVWIGTRAIIMDGVKIGNGAVIAANSVVTKDVPPYAVVGGVPAKIIKYRFNASDILTLEELMWWNNDIDWFKKNSKHMLEINNLLLNNSK